MVLYGCTEAAPDSTSAAFSLLVRLLRRMQNKIERRITATSSPRTVKSPATAPLLWRKLADHSLDVALTYYRRKDIYLRGLELLRSDTVD